MLLAQLEGPPGRARELQDQLGTVIDVVGPDPPDLGGARQRVLVPDVAPHRHLRQDPPPLGVVPVPGEVAETDV